MKIFMKSAAALAILHFGFAAQALPLFAQNAAQRGSGVLTLWPDDRDPNLFYFMPNSSTFAREQSTGLPAFGFTYWGLNTTPAAPDAGAYMSFTMRLASDAAQKAEIEAFLAADPSRGVAVLPVQESTIGINTGVKDQSPLGTLFREFNFSRVAGRAEDEVGVNAVLTAAGARVFKKAIDNPQLLKMDYCYKGSGLGPDMDAHVEIDWARVYREFEAHASGGGWFTKFTVDTTIERLRQDNAIKIKINGGTAKDEDYVHDLTDRAVTRMFKPELEMEPGAVTPNPKGWSWSKLKFAYTDRAEFKHESFDLIKRKMVEPEFCVSMRISDIAAHKAQLVQNADAN